MNMAAMVPPTRVPSTWQRQGPSSLRTVPTAVGPSSRNIVITGILGLQQFSRNTAYTFLAGPISVTTAFI